MTKVMRIWQPFMAKWARGPVLAKSVAETRVLTARIYFTTFQIYSTQNEKRIQQTYRLFSRSMKIYVDIDFLKAYGNNSSLACWKTPSRFA